MAITFKELSLIAELHYGKLPDAFKDKASEFFDALDQDGNGAVTLAELLNSNLEGKFGREFIQHVFYNLDEEGKGRLEFRECLTLYYLCMYSARVCPACERNIPQGLGYTCLKCWKEGQPPNNEFSVCLDCFSSHNYQHEHGPVHLLHDFVLFDNLLHSRPPSATTAPLAPVRSVEQTVKQCMICGDHHESAARGFTCDVHMSKMRGSTEFVCEWCFSYMCSKCGNLFRDSTTRAEPGKWLQRFVCPSCHQKNITSDCYDASLRRLQRVLSGAELLRQCKTCEIKQRNGTLFWIVNGTNTAPASAPPLSQPAWAPAPTPRSFDHQPQLHPSYSGGAGGNGYFRGSAGYDDGSFRAGRAGDGSSHGGSSRGNRAGPVNRINTPEVPPPRAGAAPLNRPSMNEATAAAVRTVNRMVNVAGRAANMFNAGGGPGGGGGGGNMFNAGGGAGGGGNMFNAGYGAGGGGDGGISSGGDGIGMASGGGNDGSDSGIGGIDTAGLLASLGSLVGGGGDGGGDAGDGSISIDASGLLASLGSLVGGTVNSDS